MRKKTYLHIPTTVSAEAVEFLKNKENPILRPSSPKPNDIKGWKKYQNYFKELMEPLNAAVVEQYSPVIEEKELLGVSILDIKPQNWTDNGKLLIFIHGGAFVTLSARTSLTGPVPVAHETGLRILSIDYTLSPFAKFKKILNQVNSVIKAIKKEGYANNDFAILGDSAGGSIAAGSVLKMRDEGLGIPSCLVLWSPWSDITETGDTYQTLKKEEPIFTYKNHLKNCADSYASPVYQRNPYVSPVYGDYKKGFPPTLIQGGTKEIFLSNFVRHYQAIDTAGQTVKLDLYEGMTHCFQITGPNLPESKLARKNMHKFLNKYLFLK